MPKLNQVNAIVTARKGDAEKQVKGAAKQVEGKVQNAVGKVKDAVKKESDNNRTSSKPPQRVRIESKSVQVDRHEEADVAPPLQ